MAIENNVERLLMQKSVHNIGLLKKVTIRILCIFQLYYGKYINTHVCIKISLEVCTRKN